MASRLDTQTNIRLPADLKRALVDAAAESGRSLSSEIENRLRESFERLPTGSIELSEKSLDAIEARMRQALRNK
jgi:predicted transcriptional regulator